MVANICDNKRDIHYDDDEQTILLCCYFAVLKCYPSQSENWSFRKVRDKYGRKVHCALNIITKSDESVDRIILKITSCRTKVNFS